jgi:hypothetical protein
MSVNTRDRAPRDRLLRLLDEVRETLRSVEADVMEAKSPISEEYSRLVLQRAQNVLQLVQYDLMVAHSGPSAIGPRPHPGGDRITVSIRLEVAELLINELGALERVPPDERKGIHPDAARELRDELRAAIPGG